VNNDNKKNKISYLINVFCSILHFNSQTIKVTIDGKELVLPLNKPVYFPGHLGKFVDTETIAIQIARDMGVINDGANLCTVTSISSNKVVLTYGIQAHDKSRKRCFRGKC
jgi:hypothetical protein